MSLHSLPLFVRLAGRPVILIGDGEAADAKRRLLERAGAVVVAEGRGPPIRAELVEAPPFFPPRQNDPSTGSGRTEGSASLAVVALEDDAAAQAAVARLKARGILVNAVDRPDLCDWTLPAIVDRDPVLVAIGTGGASAGLAAALRQRLEALLPPELGALALALDAARPALRRRLPDSGDRRRALAAALAPGGLLDPLASRSHPDVAGAIGQDGSTDRLEMVALASPDPDDLTLRQARWLASADRLFHTARVPAAILERARADAARILCDSCPDEAGGGLAIFLDMAG